MRRDHVIWLAGLYEGEGHVIFTRKAGLYLGVGSTDLDVLERFADFAGGAGIYGPYGPAKGGRKPYWQLRISGKRAYAVFVAMWPWLGQRRREQITEKVSAWLSTPCRGGRVWEWSDHA